MYRFLFTSLIGLLLTINSNVFAANPKVQLDTTKGTVIIELNPDNAESYAFRAFARFRRGDYRSAAADLTRCIALGLNFPYTHLWLYHANARAGQPDLSVLERASGAMQDGEWPRPLLDAYRGTISAEQVLAASAQHGAPGSGRRHIEATFYLGLRARSSGDTQRAREHLEEVVARAPRYALERLMAAHELRTLPR